MSHTLIQNVDDETFQGLRLESLKLVNNKLLEFSERSFRWVGNFQKVACELLIPWHDLNETFFFVVAVNGQTWWTKVVKVSTESKSKS